VFGQTDSEENAIRETINSLFEGMRKGDSAMVSRAFSRQVTLATITTNTNGITEISRETSMHEFLVAVGTPHTTVWYEETWNTTVQRDGNFAQVWCDYAFFVDTKFSHCGVDTFHLLKLNGFWKIFHLADTRRKENCKIPEEIKEKHKEAIVPK
jgi:hypothetical protein